VIAVVGNPKTLPLMNADGADKNQEIPLLSVIGVYQR